MPLRRKRWIAAGLVALIAIALVWWRRGGDAPRGEDGGAGGSDRASGDGEGSDPWADKIKRPIHGVVGDDDPTIASTGAPAIAEGVVRDAATHQPVAGADVAFWSKKGELTTETGGDGHYKLELTVGAWKARAAVADESMSRPHVVRIDAPHVTIDLEVEKLAHVHGVVRDGKSKQALAGVEVSFEPLDLAVREAIDATVGRAVLTAGDGTYKLAVPAGEVRLKASAKGKLGHRLIPAVAPGADVAADLELGGMVAIDGKVVDGKGAGIAGASVSVYVAVIDIDLNKRIIVTTGADGRFRVTDLNPGVLTIEAKQDDGGASLPKMIDLSSGDQHDIVLTMSPAVPIRGHVHYADGRVAHGAQVKVKRMNLAGTFAEAMTDSDGSFEVKGPGDSTYEITASNEYGTARLVGVRPDQSAELVIHVPGGLRGLVHAKAGAPVADYTVAIDHFQPAGNDVDLGAPAPQRYTSVDGKFEWPKLEPGTYDLTVRAAGSGTAHVGGVVVPDGAWVDIDVALDAGGAIAGRVHAGVKAIANARVDAACSGAQAITSADGAFTFADAPAGDCALTVAADGYVSAQRTAHAGAPVDVELTPGAGSKTDVEGIGVVLQPWKDSGKITGVLGPAAGVLKIGDVIVAVDGVAAGALGYAGMIAKIRGDAGTKVKIKVKRGGDEVEVELVRAHLAYGGLEPGVA